MLGRLDVDWDHPCPNCNGTSKDPKKRTRDCPVCEGTGKSGKCLNCNELMPCSGTNSNLMDQTYCEKETK